jgi:superfamily II DNA or RNA helicase
MRPVNQIIEFKQIVGRGTRLFDGKEFFTIYDFVDAYQRFSDPEWDGEPVEEDTCNNSVLRVCGLLHSIRNSSSSLNKLGNSPNRLFKNSSAEIGLPSQIVGRGTRLFDGKEFFTIYDFVDAYQRFSDPEWDGEPVEEDTQKLFAYFAIIGSNTHTIISIFESLILIYQISNCRCMNLSGTENNGFTG